MFSCIYRIIITNSLALYNWNSVCGASDIPVWKVYHNGPKFSNRQVCANIADPDLTEQSDQGLHCLPFRQHYLDTLLYCKEFLGAAPVAEWLRPLIFSTLNPHHLSAVGSSLAGVMWDEPSSGCGWSGVFFLGDLPFSPHLPTVSAQNEWNNLAGIKPKSN